MSEHYFNSEPSDIPDISAQLINARLDQPSDTPRQRLDKLKRTHPQIARYVLILAERIAPCQTKRKGDIVLGAMSVFELFQHEREAAYLEISVREYHITDDDGGGGVDQPPSSEPNDDQSTGEPSQYPPDR